MDAPNDNEKPLLRDKVFEVHNDHPQSATNAKINNSITCNALRDSTAIPTTFD